jgi:L-ribulose-5-phosphate 4-epimerase
MYEAERQQMIDCARAMQMHGLIVMSGGNVSWRMPCGNILVTPSAMSYDTMQPEDLVLMDPVGSILEGARRPSSDHKALLYIFRHMPRVNVILHTHQPYAVALSLVADELPACTTTLIDELHGAVPIAPFTPTSDEGMGIAAVSVANESLAVILKHHGVMAYGKDIAQALSAAVYLEDACKGYLAALATGLPVARLSEEQIAEESRERGYYGQP